MLWFWWFCLFLFYFLGLMLVNYGSVLFGVMLFCCYFAGCCFDCAGFLFRVALGICFT